MESKICTYTEKGQRLQLVRICNDHQLDVYELRLNRVVLDRFTGASAIYSRYAFLHAVNEICINRSTTLLKMTR